MMRSSLAVLLGLFLVSLTLRPQLIGLSPLIPLIRDDLAVSHAVAGLLNTVPVACMGLFALPVAWIAARAGTTSAIGGSALTIGAFGAARALAPDPASLLLLTVGIGIGIGILGALLPIAVKELFPGHTGLATGVYVTGIQAGAALSAALAVPVTALGSWRTSLAMFSVATAAIALGWLRLRRSRRPTVERPVPMRGLLGAVALGNPLAWLLTGLFVLNTSIYFGLNTWLPSAYVERGWTEASAATLVVLMSLASAPASLLMPWLSDRVGRRDRFLVVAAVLLSIAEIGLLVAPGAAIVWSLLAGASLGTIFPILLALPLDAADNARDVGATVALMLGVGYLITAAAPASLGLVRDVSGSFDAVLWLLVGLSALLGLLSAHLALTHRLREPRPVQGVAQPRTSEPQEKNS